MSSLLKLVAAGVIGAAVLVGAPEATAQQAAQQKVTFDLPEPTGRYQVGTQAIHLVDQNRADPWKPERKREIMVSVWYPAKHADRFPKQQWIPDGLAPSVEAFAGQIGIPQGRVDWAEAKSSGRIGAPVEGRKRPVVLYSTGFGGPRMLGTVQVQDLVSHGYVVVTIDHTYETPVEFPGGRVEQPVPPGSDQIQYMKTAIDARVADARFVLDQLPKLNRGLDGAMDLGRVGMFGHSYGGFTAGETMAHDRRIDAGINLDGTMAWSFGQDGTPYLPGEVAKRGLDRPFKLMGSQILLPDGTLVDHTHLNDFDRSWVDFWANQRGWKQDVLLKGAGHNSYSDMQTILPQLSGPLGIPLSQWVSLIGTIDPDKSVWLQNVHIRGFFDRFL